MYASATMEHLKLETGTEIVCVPHDISERKSSQHKGIDYLVKADIGARHVGFFVFGGAMLRQVTEHLQLEDASQLYGKTVAFRKKANPKNPKQALVDIDWTNKKPGVYINGVLRNAETSAATPPAPARSTNAAKPAHTSRASAAATSTNVSNVAAPEEQTAAQRRAAKPIVTPSRENLKAATDYSGNLYAEAFRKARAIATLPENKDLAFTTENLHAMTATILIEAGKVLRGDKF